MEDKRFKEIMAELGMPNSRSLLIALKQVANEVAQEMTKDKEQWSCNVCEDLKKPCTFATEKGMDSIPSACPWDTGIEPVWLESPTPTEPEGECKECEKLRERLSELRERAYPLKDSDFGR